MPSVEVGAGDRRPYPRAAGTVTPAQCVHNSLPTAAQIRNVVFRYSMKMKNVEQYTVYHCSYKNKNQTGCVAVTQL